MTIKYYKELINERKKEGKSDKKSLESQAIF